MIRIQFNDKKSVQQVEFEQISSSVVQVTGENIPRSTKGFKVYRMNGDFLGDYSEYKNIVADNGETIQFSK